MLPISVCLIAKNEALHIGECLRRLAPLHCEIIVADTGSTDETLTLASRYARVVSFTWCEDFSAAKNYAISQAAHDWILFVDCDEYLENTDYESVCRFLSDAISTQSPEGLGTFALHSPYCAGEGMDTVTTDTLVRFFHKGYYHYTGRVHEQLTPLKDTAPRYFPLPLSFCHMGYADDGIREAKALRNIALLEEELSNRGADPYLYFQLGQSYFALKQYEKAQSFFDLGLSMDIDPLQSYAQTMIVSYAYCLLSQKKYAQAMQLENVYDLFGCYADYVFVLGLIYMNNARFSNAVTAFETAVSLPLHSVEGVNSFLAYYNIGVIYECTGMSAKAIQYYSRCGQYAPAEERLSLLSRQSDS